MEETLYIVTAEIAGNAESQLNLETGLTEGHLHAFVSSRDAIEAGIKVKIALENEKYQVVRIEEIIDSNYFEFDDDVSEENLELMAEALETSTVVLGAFFVGDAPRSQNANSNKH